MKAQTMDSTLALEPWQATNEVGEFAAHRLPAYNFATRSHQAPHCWSSE